MRLQKCRLDSRSNRKYKDKTIIHVESIDFYEINCILYAFLRDPKKHVQDTYE
jgi:hypothetical protein